MSSKFPQIVVGDHFDRDTRETSHTEDPIDVDLGDKVGRAQLSFVRVFGQREPDIVSTAYRGTMLTMHAELVGRPNEIRTYYAESRLHPDDCVGYECMAPAVRQIRTVDFHQIGKERTLREILKEFSNLFGVNVPIKPNRLRLSPQEKATPLGRDKVLAYEEAIQQYEGAKNDYKNHYEQNMRRWKDIKARIQAALHNGSSELILKTLREPRLEDVIFRVMYFVQTPKTIEEIRKLIRGNDPDAIFQIIRNSGWYVRERVPAFKPFGDITLAPTTYVREDKETRDPPMFRLNAKGKRRGARLFKSEQKKKTVV